MTDEMMTLKAPRISAAPSTASASFAQSRPMIDRPVGTAFDDVRESFRTRS